MIEDLSPPSSTHPLPGTGHLSHLRSGAVARMLRMPVALLKQLTNLGHTIGGLAALDMRHTAGLLGTGSAAPTVRQPPSFTASKPSNQP